MKRLLFYLYFCLIPLSSFAQKDSTIIIINNGDDLLNIGKKIYFLEDKDGELTIEDIQKPNYQQKFEKSTKDILNFGSTSSKIWVKLTVINRTDENIFLEIANFQSWYIDFYKPNSEGKPVLSTQTGLMRPIKNREIDNNFFIFELQKTSQAQTYYFSIQTDFPTVVPLYIGSKNALIVKSNFFNWFFGIFSGWVIVMIIYNLFLAFSTKDNTYWYYVGYLIGSLFIVNFLSSNVGYQYNICTYFPQYNVALVGIVYTTTVFLFINALLSLYKTPFLYWVFAVLLVVYWILGVMNFVTGRFVNLIDLFQINSLLYGLYIFGASIYLHFKGHPTARYVVYGFSFYLLGLIILILQNFSVLPSNFFTLNAGVLGTEIEIVMFSLALGDRMNQIRKQKEVAQKSLLEKTIENEKILKLQNEVLEEKVRERTIKLQESSDELQVMNEELNSTVEELGLTLEVLDNQKKTIETINRKITSSIYYALSIQIATLPTHDFLAKHLGEYALIYRPKDIVSGDFYWIHASEDYLLIAVADCTGHGVAGAFTSLIGIDILNDLVKEHLGKGEQLTPSQIIYAINVEINKRLKQHERQSFRDGMDIGLCFIQETEKDTFSVSFAGAKRPFYYKKNGSNSFERVSGDRKSVGTDISGRDIFTDYQFDFQKGDILYLSTDGFADQNSPDRKKFGEGRLLKLLDSISNRNMEEQKEMLEQALDAHQQEAEQRDDITLLGFKL